MADVTADGRPRPGPPYPAAWEADVVLHDGSTTHVRPLRPDDADALQAFHVGQSERSTYLRFFAPLERLPERDLARLVTVDHVDRVALVAVSSGAGPVGGDHIIGVARYDRIGTDEAEVAFNIADAHQGRGLGSVLLEHLAAAARERGVRRFVAEVLPQNGRMIAVFKQAGYEVRQRTEDGIVAVGFDIDPTDRSLAVMADREHRAEALSMRGLLHASSVVVVGPGTDAGGTLAGRLASRVLADLLVGDPSVVVHAVGVPGDPPLPLHARLEDVPGPVELAVVAVPADSATDVARHLARLDVHGMVLLSAGFAEDGPDGLDRQRALLRAAHGAGLRVVGPSSYGIISTREGGLQLNASLAQEPPAPGRVGLLCQSAPLSVALLAAVRRRGIGVSQFVSAGHRADVSGNDLMQFWADDDRTDVVGLYLESLGNPRKFSRVARRLSLLKPVIVVTAGRSGQVVPPGHAVRPTHAPPRTLAEVLRQSGVVRVENTHQLLDVAQVLAHQPLPTGRRTAILASSASVAALVAEAVSAAGLVVSGHVELLAEDASPDRVHAAVDALYDDPDSDVVVVVRIPTVGGADTVLQDAVAQRAARSGRTTVACIDDLHGLTAGADRPGRRRPRVDGPRVQHARGRGAGARARGEVRAVAGRGPGPTPAPGGRGDALRPTARRAVAGRGVVGGRGDRARRAADRAAARHGRRAGGPVDPRARRRRGRGRRRADRLAGRAQDDRGRAPAPCRPRRRPPGRRGRGRAAGGRGAGARPRGRARGVGRGRAARGAGDGPPRFGVRRALGRGPALRPDHQLRAGR